MVAAFVAYFVGWAGIAVAGARPLTVLSDQAPATLNPRFALDAAGQRLGALIFSAMTRFDAELKPTGDLAESWETLEGGRVWRFKIRPGLRDHGGEPIDAARVRACLEEYRAGTPKSPHSSAFPGWVATRLEGADRVVIELREPDVYLASNLTLLRYFRVEGGDPSRPCVEPQPQQAVVGSGGWRPLKWESSPESELSLEQATVARSGGRGLRFLFVRDETSRALRLLRGDGDLALNSISLTKTRWIQRRFAEKFRVLEREGVTVGYLAFNLRDPVLSRKEVRQAFALAIPREEIVRHKLQGFCSLAGSLLAPGLEESYQAAFRFDPAEAERLLDKAGFPRKKNGVRLSLRFKTTPVREGLENALLFQAALRRIGVELVLDVVEPAVFLASVRKGAYQLHASRWIGVKDGSILFRTLRTGQLNNRTGYSDARVDAWLDAAMRETDPTKRKSLLRNVQERAAEDLPFLPLWYWNTALVVRNEVKGIEARDLSASGAFEPLARLAADRP